VNTSKALGRPRRKTKSGKNDSTREQLLTAAEQLFAEHGFAGASFRTLGASIGLSNAAMLYYYPSKKKLYSAILTRVENSFRHGLLRIELRGDPVERIRCIVDYQLAWGREHPAYVQIMMRDLVENRDRIQFARKMAMQESMSFIQRAYWDLTATGRLRDIDPAMLQYLISGAIIYFQIALPTISRLLDRPDWNGLAREFAGTIHAILQRCLTDAS
jgi:TetR/AcrR family transcriptional regulator